MTDPERTDEPANDTTNYQQPSRHRPTCMGSATCWPCGGTGRGISGGYPAQCTACRGAGTAPCIAC